jgi:hypothetical protein
MQTGRNFATRFFAEKSARKAKPSLSVAQAANPNGW